MIIAICGLKGSGKDTISNYFIKKYGFIKLHFGGILKDVCSIMFNWPRHLLEGDTVESRKFREIEDKWWSKKLGFKITPRIALQKIGTDVLRNHFNDDIWSLIIEKKINDLSSKGKNIIIADCRFQNEIKMLRSYEAKIIAVYRNLPEWFEPYKKGEILIPESIHKSEYDWIKSDFDYEINNQGSLEDLYDKIELVNTNIHSKI